MKVYGESNERRIKAKSRSKCSCGRWVRPGRVILWDVQTRITVGCASCKPESTEHHPDPSAFADADVELWDAFLL